MFCFEFSPLGIAGAAYALLSWLIGFIAVAGFQYDGYKAIKTYMCLAAIITLYYVLVAMHYEQVSEDEEKVLGVVRSHFRKQSKNILPYMYLSLPVRYYGEMCTSFYET